MGVHSVRYVGFGSVSEKVRKRNNKMEQKFLRVEWMMKGGRERELNIAST